MAASVEEICSAKMKEKKYIKNGFASSLMSNLHALWQNGEFCDIVLNVDNRDFNVHKVVLVSSSPYFNAMFGGNMSEKFQGKVNIKGVTSDSMEFLLDFCYTGEITVTENNVEDLFEAADLLGFSYVMEACASFLLDQLDPGNCIGILQIGEKHACTELCSKAQSYIITNFKAVAECNEILNLDAKQLKAFFESDEIIVDDEFEILQFILTWVRNDAKQRRKMLSFLLSAVKLSFIPPRKLREISKHSLLQADICLQNVIEEAMICHCECAGTPMRRSCAKWLYILGGEKSFMKETRSIEFFDCEKMEWNSAVKLAGSRVACAVTVLNNMLYVIGGSRQGTKLSTVQYYDPETRMWKNAAHLTKCQGEVKAAVLNGNIYVAGGSCTGQATCSYMERYSPVSNKWTTVCDMTNERRRFALVSLNNSVFAVGGFDDQRGYLSSVEHYSPDSDVWQDDSSMFYKRCDFGAVELSGYIFAVGGVNERQGSLSSVERYDISTDSWVAMSSMNRPRGGLAVAVYCGKIFAMNGMSEYMSVEDSVECYDEVSNSWKHVSGTTIARFGAAAFVFSFLIS